MKTIAIMKSWQYKRNKRLYPGMYMVPHHISRELAQRAIKEGVAYETDFADVRETKVKEEKVAPLASNFRKPRERVRFSNAGADQTKVE